MADILTSMYPISFFNGSDYGIPAYGVFQVTQDDVPDPENPPPNWPARLAAQRYDGSEGQEAFHCVSRHSRVLAINGPHGVAPGKYGKCTFAFDRPAWARFEPGKYENICLQTNTSYNENWTGVELGPGENDTDISPEGTGFIALSHPDILHSRILVRQIQDTPWGYFQAGSGSDTWVYGNRNTGGVKWEATGFRLLGAGVDDTSMTIDFRRNKGIFFGGDSVFCVRITGVWYAIETGQTCFNEAVTAESIPAGDTGDVALISGGPRVDCKGPLTGSAVPASVNVSVQWDAKTKTFLINGLGCPA